MRKNRIGQFAQCDSFTVPLQGQGQGSLVHIYLTCSATSAARMHLIYIGRHDLALRDVDKDFCKGYIAFLKTCTFNNGKKTKSR